MKVVNFIQNGYMVMILKVNIQSEHKYILIIQYLLLLTIGKLENFLAFFTYSFITLTKVLFLSLANLS